MVLNMLGADPHFPLWQIRLVGLFFQWPLLPVAPPAAWAEMAFIGSPP